MHILSITYDLYNVNFSVMIIEGSNLTAEECFNLRPEGKDGLI